MSKERLEAAKLMAKMLRLETRLPHDFPFDLVDWLVEQAERVEELEEEFVKYRNSFELQLLINNSIKNQNKRYREALEFYAEGKHVAYKLDETDDDLVADYGEKARKALEGEK